MGFLEELLDVLATLNAQRFRAGLTLLGVIIGVGTLVFLSSLLAGSEAYLKHGIQQASGNDILSVTPKDLDEKSGKHGPKLDRFDARAVATDPSLAGSGVLTRYYSRVPYGTREGQFVYVVGTLPEALGLYDLSVKSGRFLSQGDVWGVESIAIIGEGAAKQLLPDAPNPLGQEVKLGKHQDRFRVVGVLADKPSQNKGFSFSWNTSVIIPEPTYLDRFSPGREISELVVKAPATAIDAKDLARTSFIVNAVVAGRHQGIQNFKVSDPTKQDKGDQIVQLIVMFLEVSIAFICLGVGGINIMNIMVVSVAQRTREIGIRRALGATKWSIQRQFLLESMLLATAGGLLGLVGGNLFAWLLSLGLTALWGYWPFVMKPIQMLAGLLAAIFTGVVFGWYPARRAADLPPVQCLRAE